MKLPYKLLELRDQFDDRPALEKSLIALVLVSGLVWLFATFVLSPLTSDSTALRRQILQAESQLQLLSDREQAAITASAADPNEPVRARIERAIEAQRELDEQIRALAGNLVTPQSMTRLLTSILERQTGLNLVSIQNNPPEIVRTSTDAAGTESTGGETDTRSSQQIFKHSINVELEGNYLALVSYLMRIESFPERFFWDQLTFTQLSWPTARISLQLHTLSAEEGFVGV